MEETTSFWKLDPYNLLWDYLHFLEGTYFQGELQTSTAGTKASFGAWKNCWTHTSDERDSIFYGIFFVMNSHFCVANGIVPLTEKGVYARVLIKKRRYWPKKIPGDLIGQNFADKEVGVV